MVEYNWNYGRLPFPLPVLPSSLRRVRLAGRQENAGRQASSYMFVVAQPFDSSRSDERQ